MSPYIAVYGTLRPMERAGEMMANLPDIFHVTDCVIPGRIYNLGAYPGLKEEEGEVLGDLFTVSNPASLAKALAVLDRYEGYQEGSDNNLYIRKSVKLIFPATVKAWVYFYNHPVNPDSLIKGGDWSTR